MAETPHDCSATKLILLGCVKKKHGKGAAVKDLYSSVLWKYRRAYAVAHRNGASVPWFILSAKHGVLRPDDWIEPYDVTLNAMKRPQLERWAQQVSQELLDILRFYGLQQRVIEIHAGKNYADYGVQQHLERAGATVLRPLAHVVGQGVQYQWYQRHAKECPLAAAT